MTQQPTPIKPLEGMMHYNEKTNEINMYAGGKWGPINSRRIVRHCYE